MNQSSNEASGVNLPPPVSEQMPPQNANHDPSVQSAEQAPAAPERVAQAAPLPNFPLPTTPDPSVPIAQDVAQASITDDVVTTTKTKGSKIIEDTDLIEKEWVDKAKQIVDRNRDDPYKQSEQLTEFKADYMKKQYNKTIKIDK